MFTTFLHCRFALFRLSPQRSEWKKKRSFKAIALSLSHETLCECQICLLCSAFLSFRILCDKTGLVINRVACKQIFFMHCMGNAIEPQLDRLHSLHIFCGLCCVTFSFAKSRDDRTISPFVFIFCFPDVCYFLSEFLTSIKMSSWGVIIHISSTHGGDSIGLQKLCNKFITYRYLRSLSLYPANAWIIKLR